MTTKHGTTEHGTTRHGTVGTTATRGRRRLVRTLAAAGVCAVAVALTGCAGSGEGIRVEGPSAIPADLARVDAEGVDARPGPLDLRTLDLRTLDGVGVNIAEGQTVGIGVPISVTFARPVAKAERELVERQLRVAAEPGTEGSWSWVRDRDLADGQRVDFRPRASWKPGTKVTVRVGAGLTRHFTAAAR